MELTKEQISIIESYLLRKEIHFLDVKIEVLDHMISDIESLMKEKKHDFERAFHIVTKKWNKDFVQTFSLYFGVTHCAPKIVIQKAKTNFKNHSFIFLASYFIPLLILVNLDIHFSKNSIEYSNFIFRGIGIISGLFFLLTYYKKFKSKVETTYSFILKTQAPVLLLFILPICNINYFLKNGEIDGILVGLLTTLVCSAITTNYFYKKHKETISKVEKL
jgi:hypothetical protein